MSKTRPVLGRHARLRGTESVGAVGAWLSRFDSVTAISWYAALLFLVPAKLIFAPMGGGGTPANVLALLIGLWYCASRLVEPSPFATGRQPMRAALLLFAMAVLASYVSAMLRPIGANEVLAADRGLINVAAWSAICLVLADGVSSPDRLDVLLRRVVLLAVVVAAIGIVAGLSGVNLARYITIPGLSMNGDVSGIWSLQRGGLNRPSATASHPIEFGVVMAAVLPLALRDGVRNAQQGVVARWGPAAVIALGGMMSISRSAVIGFVIVAAVMLVTWPPRRRRALLASMVVFAAVVRVAVPGLLGTVRNLFTSISSDTSTTARTADYGGVWAYVQQRPWFGRGFGTFMPVVYRFTDNQYLNSIVEIGFVGVASLLLLFAVGIALIVTGRSRSLGDSRELGNALLASLLVLAVTFVTFDALGFPMVAGLTFLVLGASAAYWRLAAQPHVDPVPVMALAGSR